MTAGPRPSTRSGGRRLLAMLMRYPLSRRAIGIQGVYRDAGGGLIVGGLAYAALFAIIPTFILVVVGIYLVVDDPTLRQDAIDVIVDAFPALEDVTAPVIERAQQFLTFGSIVALIGFAWGASGLYLYLTRAMERFFPGKRVSGVLARVAGVLLVVLVIVGVLAAVFLAGVVTVVARALSFDSEFVLTAVGAAVTLGMATGLVYGIYRLVPANPPAPRSARLPAILVGLAIGALTLFYGLISPWLVAGFQAFGVMASVFVALVWLRLVFLAMVYGAAMARYRDVVAITASRGEAEPDAAATEHILEQEKALGREEVAERTAAPAEQRPERDETPGP